MPAGISLGSWAELPATAACDPPPFPATTKFSGGIIFQLCLLASGSSGNCTWLATGKTRLLVDAGLSVRETLRRLAEIAQPPERIDGILVTHEHSDHVSGLPRLARRLGVPVFATERTAASVDWGEAAPRLEIFQAGARLAIGDIDVDTFSIPHDAADPVGFCFRSQGIKIGLVTDLGYVPDSVRYQLRGTTALVLESNHDLEMLKVGPYPWPVKQRVMSRVGHLSNEMACEFVLTDLDSGTATLILAHLSEHNNHPEIVRMFAGDALARRGVSPRLVVAEQRRPTEIFVF